MPTPKITKCFCSRCHQETNHKFLFTKVIESDPDLYHCAYLYQVIECLGCENISYRTIFNDYESSYPDEYGNWRIDSTTNIYPTPLKKHKPLTDTYILPAQIRTVYKESIDAFKANCFLLTGVGFRAVIEAICIEKKISGRDLETKINNLAKNRFITDKEANRLHSIRFMGNDSVHEMNVPKENSLYVVLDIIENLLKNLYVIDFKAKGNIETFINDLDDFYELLNPLLQKYNVNDEFPLAKFLGKSVRRFNGRLNEFESLLMTEINSGKYDRLSIGKLDTFGNSTDTVQHFIITKEAKNPITNPNDIPF